MSSGLANEINREIPVEQHGTVTSLWRMPRSTSTALVLNRKLTVVVPKGVSHYFAGLRVVVRGVWKQGARHRYVLASTIEPVETPALDQLRRGLEAHGLWDQVPGLRLELHGQLPSGKNQVGIQHEAPVILLAPATVRHYPNARFERWRREAERQLVPQLGTWRASLPLSVPMLMYVWYWPGDRRTRDRSGMLDALFHLLEHAGVIANDRLIEDPVWRTMPLDTKHPRVVIVLRPYFPVESRTLSYAPQFDRPSCVHCWMPVLPFPLSIPA